MSDGKVINLEVEAGRKGIEVHPDGGISITGKDSVNLFRLLTLKSGMEFEVNCPGMKLTRGPSCFTRVKREYGFKGNKRKVYEQFCNHFGFDQKTDLVWE